MSNKWNDAYRSQLKLLNVVRTQYVNEDSFGCVYETEDSLNNRGVRLSKEIVKVAGRAMEKNFTTLGPYVLPLSEQIKTGFWMLIRFLSKKFKSVSYQYNEFSKKILLSSLLLLIITQSVKINPYIPDFKRGIDHFCIHAGL